MAEAPDAQFVAEDAVVVYHKKFSVTFHDDNVYYYNYTEDDILRVSCCFPIMWLLRILSLKFIPRGGISYQYCPFLQENWFHDCDNEHAKITAFFQVRRVTKMEDEERQDNDWCYYQEKRAEAVRRFVSLKVFFLPTFSQLSTQLLEFTSGRAEQGTRINWEQASFTDSADISGGRIMVNIK